MSQPTTSFTNVLFAAAVMLAVWGCSGVEADTAPVIAGTGDLPKAIGTMTAGELFDAGEKLSFVSGPWQTRNCAKGSCKARIQAVKSQKPGPGNVTTNGTIVARLKNRGSWLGTKDEGIEEKYKLKRFSDDKSAYYLVAIGDGSGGWRWGIYEAIEGGPNVLVPTDTGAWTPCTRDVGNRKHPQGESEFAKCPHPSSVANQTQALNYDPLDPGWLDCQQGCCTAGQ